MKVRRWMKKTILTFGMILGLGIVGGATVSADEVHTVTADDTLSTITFNKYGNLDSMFKLAKVNNIADLHLIYDGEALTLPDTLDNVTLTDAELETYKAQLAGEAVGAVVVEEAAVETTTPEVPQEAVAAPVEVAEAPVQETYTEPVVEETYVAPVETTPTVATSSSAKEWIAQKESGGSYTAVNASSGAYGRYQLMSFNLKYGSSPEGQERAADEYVASRYGSWEAAQAFHMANGWY